MDDYISKPIRMKDLVKVLSKCQPRGTSHCCCSQNIVSTGTEEAEKNMPSAPEQGVVAQLTAITPAIDIKTFQDMLNMVGKKDYVFINKLINIYLEGSVKDIQVMRQAVQRGDAISLRLAAHKLKSSSASLGAMVLSNFCKELEAMSRNGNIAGSAQKLQELCAEYERVRVALEH